MIGHQSSEGTHLSVGDGGPGNEATGETQGRQALTPQGRQALSVSKPDMKLAATGLHTATANVYVD